MEEKKLTDEVVAENATTDEIIKAINYLAETGEGRGWIDGYKCKVIKFADVLDLIHRLQGENERLTEWKDKLQDTKDELEQQLIDTGFKEYCEENKRLTDENAELEKQVDELKANQVIECHGMLKGCDIVNQAVKDTAKEILAKAPNDTGADERFIFWLRERFGV